MFVYTKSECYLLDHTFVFFVKKWIIYYLLIYRFFSKDNGMVTWLYTGGATILVSTFEGMATEVNTQKHLRLLLLYVGAQWLFKARPSVQYTLQPKYFQIHRLVSLSCIKRGPHPGQREHYFHVTAGCLHQCLIPPLASVLDWESPCID